MKRFAAVFGLILAACSAHDSPSIEDVSNPSPDAGATRSDACAAGARDCANGAAVACVNGAWVTEARCEFPRPHCAAGRCIECLRGEVACQGASTVLLCDETGSWQAAAECSGPLPVCLDGRCAECLPGRHLCDGRRPILCRGDGTYATQAPCENGTRCVFGECVPDQPPTVRILEPVDGALLRLQQENHTRVELAVRGEVVDPEDGGLVDWHLTWSTDRLDLHDGARILARGANARVWLRAPQPCQEARHELTLSAMDSASNTGKATVTVVVGCYVEPSED